MLQVLDLRKLRKLLRELLRLLRKQLQKQRLMKSRLNLRLRVLYVLLSNFYIITNEFKNRADDKFARFFGYYSRNRHTSFAFVALTGSRFVLHTKAAHMGAVPASQAFGRFRQSLIHAGMMRLCLNRLSRKQKLFLHIEFYLWRF